MNMRTARRCGHVVKACEERVWRSCGVRGQPLRMTQSDRLSGHIAEEALVADGQADPL